MKKKKIKILQQNKQKDVDKKNQILILRPFVGLSDNCEKIGF